MYCDGWEIKVITLEEAMSTKFISFVPLSNSDRRPSILEAMISNNMRARQNNLDRRSKLAWFGFVNWVGFELRLGIVRVV